MEKSKFALGKQNYILLAVGMCIIIVGFLLMLGPATTEAHYEPDVFSARRIKLAPVVAFFGFIFMIFGILYTPKSKK